MIFLKDADTVVDLVAHFCDLILQLHQDIKDIVIRFGADAFGFGARLGKDLFGTALGFLRDNVLLRKLVGFVAGKLQGAVGFLLRLRHDPVALGNDLLGFFHFFGDGDAHLVDQFKHLIFIHDNVMRERHSLRIVEKLFETVD